MAASPSGQYIDPGDDGIHPAASVAGSLPANPTTVGATSRTAASGDEAISGANSGGEALPRRFSEKSQRLEDEEEARRIADRDLNAPHKQEYSGLVLLWVAFQATGVIYGDIGTSPLYVFSASFSSQPTWDDMVGALSVVIWSLTLIVTIKYTFIVLRADDDGQGGAFALYSLLARHSRIIAQDPRALGVRGNTSEESPKTPTARFLRRLLEKSYLAQTLLKVVGLAGVSLVMADGVLTPAQSVLGAVQGIRVANPSLETSAVVGTSCAVLVLLFAIQPLGTARIGTAFAPIVTIWLLFNLCSGIYNLAVYDSSVLRAFSPHHALMYLVRGGHAGHNGSGWRSLGGLLLAFTGVEALFADLGAFSRRAIQISWLCLAYPCLLIAYSGQAAFIVRDTTGTAFTNPFFNTVPPGSFYFGLVIAILAAIVASQAMVTSVFQLLIQVMRMSYFPHIRVVHTSTRFHEQVYVPLANWALMVGTVIVTAAYNNTTSLGNAYGVCVILVAFITTCMVALVAILVWQLPLGLVLVVFAFFIALDGAFLSAALVKVPEGAWFTLLLAALISSVFILWRYGKEAQWAAETSEPLSLGTLLTTTYREEDDDDGGGNDDDGDNGRANGNGRVIASGRSYSYASIVSRGFGQVVRLRSPLGSNGTPVSTVPGLGIFFDKIGDPTQLPPSFTHFVRKFAARPSVIIFFHMRALPVPSVAPQERFVVCRFGGRHDDFDEDNNVVNNNAAAAAAGQASNHSQGHSSNQRRANTLLPDAYVVVLRHGYADDVLRTDLGRDLVAQLQLAIMKSVQPLPPSLLLSPEQQLVAVAARREAEEREDRELAALREACIAQTVFVLGKEAMRVRRRGHAGGAQAGGAGTGGTGGTGNGGSGLLATARRLTRRVLLEAFLWIRDNSRTKLADLDIDVDKLVEVGFVKDI